MKMAALVSCWLALVLAGSGLLLGYAGSSGQSGSPSEKWPETNVITLDPVRPTLVMFIHPRCPCSRASIGELDQLIARSQGKLKTQVLFIRPEGTEEGWERTDLWTQAKAIPGIELVSDIDGKEARRFQIETSGQTLLYSADGTLLFQGGITKARGHYGDNDGLTALIELAGSQGSTGKPKTPVFGCELFETGTRCQQPDKLCTP